MEMTPPMLGPKNEFKKLPHNLLGGEERNGNLAERDPPGRKVGLVILHCSQRGIHLKVTAYYSCSTA